MRVSDFPVGSTVKVVGPFPDNLAYLRSYIGWYGRVGESLGDRVVVEFTPQGQGAAFPPETLEWGRIEWMPETEDR
jgi:hypothetical protein